MARISEIWLTPGTNLMHPSPGWEALLYIGSPFIYLTSLIDDLFIILKRTPAKMIAVSEDLSWAGIHLLDIAVTDDKVTP